MNLFKTSLIALASLGLSAAAQAGNGYGHAHGKHRWERPAQHRIVHAKPRCSAPVRVVYKPVRQRHTHARVVLRPGQVVVRPGVHVQIAFGF